MINKNPVGRPKLPDSERKVLFAKRVHPSKIPELLELIMKDKGLGTKHVESQTVKVNAGLTGKLLDDNERLEKEVVELKEKLERCSRASDDEKFRVLLYKYDKAVARVAELEGSQ